MQPIFTIKEAVSYGWKKTWENVGFLALLSLGLFIVQVMIAQLAGPENVVDGRKLFQILNTLVGYFGMFAIIRMCYVIHRGGKPAGKDVFEIEWGTFGYYVLASVLSSVITGIGFILLIIPGIYISIRLAFYMYPVIDERQTSIESLKTSWNITRGRFWEIFGFMIVLVFINILGAIALGVGLLITMPLSVFATIFVYEKLKATAVPVSPTSPQAVNSI